MSIAAASVIGLLFMGLLAVIAAAMRLDARIDAARERFRVVTGGYGEADLLAGARRRFRQRQRRLETAVDTGTIGLERAHRTLSQALGGRADSGAGAYAWLRGFNRGLGRTVAGLFAPGPRRASESLEQWRARQAASTRDDRGDHDDRDDRDDRDDYDDRDDHDDR